MQPKSLVSERRPSPPHHANGLWGLWDMLEFYAKEFVELSRILAALRMSMIQLKSGQSIAEHLRAQPEGRTSGARMAEVKQQVIGAVQEHESALGGTLMEVLSGLCHVLEYMGLNYSLKETKWVSDKGQGNIQPDDLESLFRRIRDELDTHVFFQLDPLHRKYYAPDQPLFGEEFAEKFASAVFELDEAGKCLAFDRSTAAVFQLMRLIEIGINALAACLQMPPPTKDSEKNWGVILRSIKDKMIEKKGAWSNADDKAFFEGAYASLDAVKNAWRNPTMHVEKKYTHEEATHVFDAVRAFMKNLASRMDEAGAPFA